MTKLEQYDLEGMETYLLDILGDDPMEERSQKYISALQGIGLEGMKFFLSSLLERGIPDSIVQNSYFHPNKFFKLGVCRLANCVKMRLHFWSKEHLEAKTPIHSHAWDYASLLLSGSYLHETFRVVDVAPKEIAEIEQYQKMYQENPVTALPDRYFGLYKIPKRDEASGKFQPEWIKYVRAEREHSCIEKRGTAYFLGMEFPHQISMNLQETGSVITLVLTSVTDRKNLFTLQPIYRNKSFDNPSPNVDAKTVKQQVELILQEISA